MTRRDRILELCDPRNWLEYVQIMITMSTVRRLVERVEIPVLLSRLNRGETILRPFQTSDLERAWIGWRFADLVLVRILRSKTPCLVRSLTLFHLFRRRGLDARIVFGVQKNTSPLKGHSWILINGRTPLEPGTPEVSCVAIYSYP